MKDGFDGGLRYDFHGARVKSDAGLPACREFEDAPGLYYPFVLLFLSIDAPDVIESIT